MSEGALSDRDGPSDELVEAVARAICACNRVETAVYDGAADLHEWVNEMWSEWMPEARVAIEAYEIERILVMTDGECLAEGVREYGSEEAWRKAMAYLKANMLKELGLDDTRGEAPKAGE